MVLQILFQALFKNTTDYFLIIDKKDFIRYNSYF